MGKAGRNERRKVAAQYLNGLASAVVAAGVLVPAAAGQGIRAAPAARGCPPTYPGESLIGDQAKRAVLLSGETLSVKRPISDIEVAAVACQKLPSVGLWARSAPEWGQGGQLSGGNTH